MDPCRAKASIIPLDSFTAVLCRRLILSGVFTEELGHAFFKQVRHDIAEGIRLGHLRESLGSRGDTETQHYAWVVQWSREAADAGNDP
jgi:hypothetical protein